MKNIITKQILEILYINEKLSPYKIAEKLECDHKTIRSYLKKFNIKLRTPQEYNYVCKISHTSPTQSLLNTKLSIMAHVMYICEGWHTEKTGILFFVNQDTSLIDIFIDCVENVYKYTSPILIEICYNFNDEKSKIKADEYNSIYSHRKTRMVNDKSRKNPILRVRAGGKNLAREFIANAYKLLNE